MISLEARVNKPMADALDRAARQRQAGPDPAPTASEAAYDRCQEAIKEIERDLRKSHGVKLAAKRVADEARPPDFVSVPPPPGRTPDTRREQWDPALSRWDAAYRVPDQEDTFLLIAVERSGEAWHAADKPYGVLIGARLAWYATFDRALLAVRGLS